jgi:hypothetical protein
MQMNTEWTAQKVLPLKLEKTKIKYSIYSIIISVIAIGYIVYSLYNRFIE